MQTINHKTLSAVIRSAVEADLPLFLWGSPGVGKSDAVRAAAAALDAQVVDIRLSLYDSVDLRGLPASSKTKTTWLPPATLPFVGSNFPTDRVVILFLDELTQAAPAVQAAAFQLVLDRGVGEHRLMPNVRVVAASNRDSDKAATSRMPTPLANRFIHVEVAADFAAWRAWALESGIHPLILGYLESRPHHLDGFDTAIKRGDKAFPTPRSWGMVSRVLSTVNDPSARDALIAGAVGSGVAAEFELFLRTASSVPAWDDIVARPSEVAVPTENDALYAVAATLAARVDAASAEAVAMYTARLPLEYQAIAYKGIAVGKTALFAGTACLRDAGTALLADLK